MILSFGDLKSVKHKREEPPIHRCLQTARAKESRQDLCSSLSSQEERRQKHFEGPLIQPVDHSQQSLDD